MVGRVVRPHGLRGVVVVEPFTDDPATRFAPGADLALADGTSLTVAAYQATDRLPLLTFEEITGRDQAERLRGRELLIPIEARRPLSEGEYWPDELVGMDVVTSSGELLGKVAEVEIGVGQDRLVVSAGHQSIAVPFVAALVPEIDPQGRRILVDLPPGLID